MARAAELGQAGLQGWRLKLADNVSRPVADRAPLEEEQVRALIGAVFFALSLMYVIKTISAAVREAR